MNILALDTCNNYCSVGLYNENLTLSDINNDQENMQSLNLVPMIDSILAKNNLKLSDITKIIITNGPGSFTGIRVGLSWAIGIEISTNIKILTINNLAASYISSLNSNKEQGKFLVINKATKKNIYYQFFEKFAPLSLPIFADEKNLLEIISEKNLTIIGNYFDLKDKLENFRYIEKIKMGNIAKFLADNRESQLFNHSSIIEPIYLRDPIC